jgi:RNA polymerase sigma factor (sigma-70 family)
MGAAPLHTLLGYIRRLGSDGADGGDGELVRRFAADRDEAAFTTLVRRHGPMVWSVCSRLACNANDAEDAFQATFLILARKAASLRNPESLGPWLYGVARRVALKIRHAVRRRQARECPAEDLPAPPDEDRAWRDLRPLLDEEVGRLPEKYRLPFVLCYLEGVTNEEAARRLRCPKGTILSRLSRARERLRGRLVRRGVELSGVALATVLTTNAGPAAVPPPLLTDTVRTGLAFAAGSAGAGPAVSLASGVLHSMFLTKVKMTVAALVALCVVGSGAGLLGRKADAGGPPAAQPAPAKAVADKPPADPSKAEAAAAPASSRGMELQKALAAPAPFKGMDDPKTTLIEALDLLAKGCNVTFDVNEKAFLAEQLNDVLRTPVAETPIPEMRTSLQHILKKVLARVPSPSGATFVIRKDHIEITTTQAIRTELGIAEDRPLLPLVYEEFEDKALPAALKALASASGMSVVLDGQAAPDKGVKVTADFHNVPVDTAVRVLADMAELGMVRLDNVLYVTTREKAKQLQAEQKPVAATPKAAPSKSDKKDEPKP